jgi:hypothetical protein
MDESVSGGSRDKTLSSTAPKGSDGTTESGPKKAAEKGGMCSVAAMLGSSPS